MKVRMRLLKQWTEIEDQFLTNKPRNAPHPRGTDWEYYLWAYLVKRYRMKRGIRVVRRRYLHILSGPTKYDVTEQLRRLVKRRDVRIVG